MELFHTQKNEFFALVRQWYAEGILEDSDWAKKQRQQSLGEKQEKFSALTLPDLNGKDYCFSNLDQEVTLPFLFTSLEKRYLKTIQNHPLFQEWVDPSTLEAIKSHVEPVTAFPFDTFYTDMDRKGIAPPSKEIVEKIKLLAKAIQEQKQVIFLNVTNSGEKYPKSHYSPYKLLYDKELCRWQLICFSEDQPVEFPCNIENLQELSLTELAIAPNLPHKIKENRETPLVLHVTEYYNSPERCFLLFEDYHSTAQYHADTNSFQLTLFFNKKWDTEDILEKILSLGQAVEVVSPAFMQKKLYEALL